MASQSSENQGASEIRELLTMADFIANNVKGIVHEEVRKETRWIISVVLGASAIMVTVLVALISSQSATFNSRFDSLNAELVEYHVEVSETAQDISRVEGFLLNPSNYTTDQLTPAPAPDK